LNALLPACQQVEAARASIASLVRAAKPAVEAARARFDPFLYLFSAEERRRIGDVLASPKCDVGALRGEMGRIDRALAAIDAACEDSIVQPFTTLDTTALKDAFKARARLLGTMIMRSLRAHVLYAAECINTRYGRLSRRLRFYPSSSEELVVLAEFIKAGMDKETKACYGALYTANGMTDTTMLLYTEGLAREF